MATFDGHRIEFTNRDKVLYPATGTTKGDVIDYYIAIAPVMLPHVIGRPVTRKRWPNGVDHPSFFEKNLAESAPDWLPRRRVTHRVRTVRYPVLESVSGLAWLGQQAALEAHVPQWRFGAATGEEPGPVTRMVFDLDPGEDVTLVQCAEVAVAIRDRLAEIGLETYPVTSGSKGIHLYVPMAGRGVHPPAASELAKKVAQVLEKQWPERVTANMSRAQRPGKVFVDWSQNNGNKTTVAPYSLRGREQPWVAAPRSWDELSDKDLRHLRFDEVLERMRADGDLLAAVDADLAGSDAGSEDGPQSLSEYRRKRDARKTPEPVPETGSGAAGPGNSFVIHEHHARRLHWDFRLERDGVLASWAVPKNLPTDPGQNHLAVHVEDHPLEYGKFEGDIPKGEYGAGHVDIYDAGTYDTIKWRDDEVIVDLHGDRVSGRYALIQTKGDQWLAHRMKDQDGSGPAAPHDLRPMLATSGSVTRLDGDGWAFEGKWDGYRAIVRVDRDGLHLTSRSGRDFTADYPAFDALAEELSDHTVVLDGEIVALGADGAPSFGLLQNAGGASDMRLYLFDVLYLDGVSLIRKPYQDRRRVLEALAPAMHSAEVPAALPGPAKKALDESRRRGLEGVVAKRLDSTYLPGRRGTAWVKEKHWRTQEVVIGGWSAGEGRRAESFGSLLLGVPTEDGLRYVGKVGTGFTDAQLSSLGGELARMETEKSPFAEDLPAADRKGAHWVRPEIVGEVRYAERTDSGHLRHPSWRGLRPDKTVDEVRWE